MYERKRWTGSLDFAPFQMDCLTCMQSISSCSPNRGGAPDEEELKGRKTEGPGLETKKNKETNNEWKKNRKTRGKMRGKMSSKVGGEAGGESDRGEQAELTWTRVSIGRSNWLVELIAGWEKCVAK